LYLSIIARLLGRDIPIANIVRQTPHPRREERTRIPMGNKLGYIVMLHPDDAAKNFRNTPTRIHPTAHIAEAEATRLAKEYPNQRFCVGVIYKHYMSYNKIVEVEYERSE
jgi:hypothetical protein